MYQSIESKDTVKIFAFSHRSVHMNIDKGDQFKEDFLKKCIKEGCGDRGVEEECKKFKTE